MLWSMLNYFVHDNAKVTFVFEFQNFYFVSMIHELIPMFLETIPEYGLMQDGILYVSERFKTSTHLCPCGCKEEIVVPFNYEDFPQHHWNYKNDNGFVTLWPSIGNYQIPCKTHYYIIRNEISWLP